jgi:hypothetical protein
VGSYIVHLGFPLALCKVSAIDSTADILVTWPNSRAYKSLQQAVPLLILKRVPLCGIRKKVGNNGTKKYFYGSYLDVHEGARVFYFCRTAASFNKLLRGDKLQLNGSA